MPLLKLAASYEKEKLLLASVATPSPLAGYLLENWEAIVDEPAWVKAVPRADMTQEVSVNRRLSCALFSPEQMCLLRGVGMLTDDDRG